jgi:hypothetical protein
MIEYKFGYVNRFELITGQDEDHKRLMVLRMPAPDESKGDLTPVMVRLGSADLETLDTLITAGFAANRAYVVR